jgi:RHS repeat-associated protein
MREGAFMYDAGTYAYDAEKYYLKRASDYRARYYDPATGRFVSEDPLRFLSGVHYYVYVQNRPVNAKDPTGLMILLCSREGFQNLGGVGNHAYLYDTQSGRNCGRGSRSGKEDVNASGIKENGLSNPGAPGGRLDCRDGCQAPPPREHFMSGW